MSISIKKNRIEKISEQDVLALLGKDKIEALNNVTNSSKFSDLRKTVYLSGGGKYYKYVDFMLRFTYEMGNVPIHPILTLNYYISTISHNNNKKEIVRDCFSLMKDCEELWVFDEKLPTFNKNDHSSDKKHISDFPEGVLAEILWWLRYRKTSPIRFFTWRDVGIPKYLREKDWKLIPGNKKNIGVTDSSGRFGIIDLGSSTIKLNVSDVDSNNQITTVLKKSITTNLAEDFFNSGLIKDKAKERTIEGLKDLKDEAIEQGVTDFKLLGTKVIRDAKNSAEVVEEIEKETGLKLEILSKENEAMYVAKAVLDSFENKTDDMVIINAGGGSTQVMIYTDGKIKDYSLSIGISDLNERFLQEYPISTEKYEEMKRFIKDTIIKEVENIPSLKTLVYTGGELDYMLITGFPLDEFDGSISHPKKLTLKDYKVHTEKMREMTLEEIQAFMPSNPNWMNGAIASNTLLEVLCEVFNISVIIPSNKNVNDGILLTMK